MPENVLEQGSFPAGKGQSLKISIVLGSSVDEALAWLLLRARLFPWQITWLGFLSLQPCHGRRGEAECVTPASPRPKGQRKRGQERKPVAMCLEQTECVGTKVLLYDPLSSTLFYTGASRDCPLSI